MPAHKQSIQSYGSYCSFSVRRTRHLPINYFGYPVGTRSGSDRVTVLAISTVAQVATWSLLLPVLDLITQLPLRRRSETLLTQDKYKNTTLSLANLVKPSRRAYIASADLALRRTWISVRRMTTTSLVLSLLLLTAAPLRSQTRPRRVGRNPEIPIERPAERRRNRSCSRELRDTAISTGRTAGPSCTPSRDIFRGRPRL